VLEEAEEATDVEKRRPVHALGQDQIGGLAAILALGDEPVGQLDALIPRTLASEERLDFLARPARLDRGAGRVAASHRFGP
jgi:hypothetical protein